MEIASSRQLALAGSALALGLAFGLAGLTQMAEPGALRISALSVVVELLLLSLALAGAWATRQPPREALGWAPGRLPGRSLALLAVATLGASHALDGILELLDLRGESALEELADALQGIRGVELAAALVALGLMPALAEELLCRGLIQRSLARRLGPVAAIGVSSLLFALLHGEAIHALLAAPLGVHLGIVAWWSDSTRSPVLCHAVNNLAAVVLGALALHPPGSAALQIALGLAVCGAGWAGALRAAARPAASSLQPSPRMDDR